MQLFFRWCRAALRKHVFSFHFFASASAAAYRLFIVVASAAPIPSSLRLVPLQLMVPLHLILESLIHVRVSSEAWCEVCAGYLRNLFGFIFVLHRLGESMSRFCDW